MSQTYESKSYDPAYNLAVEESLLLGRTDGAVLYLWQNRNTVVIGRNQNAWKECRVKLLESEGGRLVRRSSGGGAVYHDLGNLNFSFIVPRERYDLGRQLSVLTGAVAQFGLGVELSGRNDVLLVPTGEKFSGNAFRFTERNALHHGTILVDVDMDRLSRYLAPSREKLAAKGVDSVRARVTNLKAHAPGMTVEDMKQAMRRAFAAAYGPAEELPDTELNMAQIEALRARNNSWDWIYGKTPAFDLTLETRFSWGGAELLLSVRHGRVETARLYTDAMDADLSDAVENALAGAPCTREALAERLLTLPAPQAQELGRWLAESSGSF